MSNYQGQSGDGVPPGQKQGPEQRNSASPFPFQLGESKRWNVSRQEAAFNPPAAGNRSSIQGVDREDRERAALFDDSVANLQILFANTSPSGNGDFWQKDRFAYQTPAEIRRRVNI